MAVELDYRVTCPFCFSEYIAECSDGEWYCDSCEQFYNPDCEKYDEEENDSANLCL